MQTDRRNFVKATGMVAVLGGTGLAGCSGLLGGNGGATSAQGWQYDPSILAETSTKFFGSMDYAQVYENREAFPQSTQDSLEGSEDSPIDPANVDFLSGVGGAQLSMQEQSFAFYGSVALTGSFDTDAVSSEIQSDGDVQESGEYEGYTLYEMRNIGDTGVGMSQYDGSGTVGVGDSAVIFGVSAAQGTEPAATGEDAVRTSIDASAGNADSLHDNSEYASELSNQIGDATMLIGGEVDPNLVDTAEQQAGSGMSGQLIGGIRAGGFGAAVGGETTTFTFAGIYESAQRAEDSGVVGMVQGFSQQFEQQEGVNSVDANQDGATVVVTLEGDTETLLQQGQSAAPGPTFNVAPQPF